MSDGFAGVASPGARVVSDGEGGVAGSAGGGRSHLRHALGPNVETRGRHGTLDRPGTGEEDPESGVARGVEPLFGDDYHVEHRFFAEVSARGGEPVEEIPGFVADPSGGPFR